MVVQIYTSYKQSMKSSSFKIVLVLSFFPILVVG